MFKLMINQQPKSSGYYYVKWDNNDPDPDKVYLWDCRDIFNADGSPLWNWGIDEYDDPESITIDVEEPWLIQWCEVHEFETVK